MSRLPQSQLLQRLDSAIARGGAAVTVLDNAKPFLIALNSPAAVAAKPFRVFIWNITHGGNTRSANEYRIQVTPAMPTPVVGETVVVLGWHEELGVFAAWDPSTHSQRNAASPSLQVGLDVLQFAAASGISAEFRGSGDSVIAFQPELLEFYLNSADILHSLSSEAMVSLISDFGDLEPSNPQVLDAIERPVIERIVTGRYRDATFSARVNKAYGYSCAICSQQLAMTEAAHIVPVAEAGSTDETCNGVALCRNHHHAFDQALIFIDNDYRVWLNPSRVSVLDADNLTAGLEDLLPENGIQLSVLPADPVDRPKKEYLQRGRTVRKVAS